jgi:bacterioferritin
LELSAVQQYMTQAKLTESWGMIDASDRLRREVVEELRHAERITAYMLALGMAPNASQLRPVGAGPTLYDLLAEDYRLEADIIHLYQDATLYCGRVGERDGQAFFQQLLSEEQEHAEALHHWMQELGGDEAAVAAAHMEQTY